MERVAKQVRQLDRETYFDIMKDFYVQLISNASTTEFPANSANSFKNRLPYPLRFNESEWKVGLTSITYPIPPLKSRSHQTHTFQPEDLICRFKWVMKSLDIRDNVVFNTYTFELKGQDLNQARDFITGGKSLMKYIVNRYETYLRQNVTDKGDSLISINGDEKKFYPVFRWEGDDLNLDNSHTFLNETDTRKRPEVLFGTKLVEAMNWIGTDGHFFYYTNGNLRSEADSVPDDVQRDWPNVDQYRSWSELWNYSYEGLQLSPYCDWRFVYLDEAYHKAFGGTVVSKTPHRSPIYVYSDVGQSMITGHQVTDLLREIPHDPTKMTYEPKHVLYPPVRVQFIDIIETRLVENDGSLVDFTSGVTTVTLHFKL